MVYYLVNAGMTLSVLFFATGYWKRKQMNVHRIWMGLGVLANLVTAVLLVVAVHAFAGGDMKNAGFHPTVASHWILTHRVIAVVAALLMLAMAATGAMRKRKVHIALHYVFIPLYLIVYVSGLFMFEAGS
ncbi:MAG: hypothetical protein CMN77_07445 [Spirochaetaceae bacterium]|nr:hypothetical protein [Spirochaetaceae bacterium]|tara:strand:- start:16131 stop:16520 length:390 start_codon:yes stop_codon:yes gene_type:complete